MELLTQRIRVTQELVRDSWGKRVGKMFKTQLIGPFFFEEDTIRQVNFLDIITIFVYPLLRIGNRIWFSSWMVNLFTAGDWTCAPFWTQSSPIVGSAEMGLHHGATFSGHNSTWLFSMGLCEEWRFGYTHFLLMTRMN